MTLAWKSPNTVLILGDGHSVLPLVGGNFVGIPL